MMKLLSVDEVLDKMYVGFQDYLIKDLTNNSELLKPPSTGGGLGEAVPVSRYHRHRRCRQMQRDR